MHFGKIHFRVALLSAAAAAIGSTALAIGLGGAEAHLNPVPDKVTFSPSLCAPVCESHVVASGTSDGSALVIPGVSAVGMAFEGDGVRVKPVRQAPATIDVSAAVGFSTGAGASASFQGDVGLTEIPVANGGYAIAALELPAD